MVGPVVVVGSINVDLVVTVDELPREGETVSGGTFRRHGGGKGANQAVAAARAGAPTTMIGAVGQDPEGDAAIADLEREQVDATFVARTDAAATGVAVIVVDAAGHNQIAVAPGANRLLGAVPPGLVREAAGVVLLSFEAPDAVVCEVAELAYAAGWTIIANPAPWRPIPARLAACRPILVPNEHEAEGLTALADPAQAARRLTEVTAAPVVITLGAQGALLDDGRQQTIVPAERVEAVDTTGAGDALCGTLAARIAAGDSLEDALRAAVATATATTLKVGAR